MGKCWSCRRCGPGADAPASANEPIYERLGQHQAHDCEAAAGSIRLMREMRETLEGVQDLKQLLLPVADITETMRRLEEALLPLNTLLVMDEDQYVDMTLNTPRPSPAADIYVLWLEERINYGEPW